eukprot:463656-Rhodomonas_salina.6
METSAASEFGVQRALDRVKHVGACRRQQPPCSYAKNSPESQQTPNKGALCGADMGYDATRLRWYIMSQNERASR